MVDDKVWQTLDMHRDKIEAQKISIAIVESRTTALERGHVDMCVQIKNTEHKVMLSQDEIKKDVLLILSELDQMKGARKALGWMPTFIQVCVGLTVLYAVMTRN